MSEMDKEWKNELINDGMNELLEVWIIELMDE